jgi:Icc-related predicted phosphoesterase
MSVGIREVGIGARERAGNARAPEKYPDRPEAVQAKTGGALARAARVRYGPCDPPRGAARRPERGPAGPAPRAGAGGDAVPEWFFTSDLHGQTDFYEQALAAAVEGRARAVLLGGDLCPHAGGADGVRRQRLFLEGTLVEFACRLREALPGSTLLLLMGNDDWSDNQSVLDGHDGDLWRVIHERATIVDGVPVAGLSWVPITPFGMKDWDRWEDGEPESPPRLDGWRSRDGALHAFAFEPGHRSPTIAEALGGLATLSRPGDTVYVLHSPPRDTACDTMMGGAHVGSRAIRAFVERHAPPLVLSGHIHEAPRVSGAWRDRLGATTIVNPGQFGSPRLCGAWFDPARPAETLRHTVHS